MTPHHKEQSNVKTKDKLTVAKVLEKPLEGMSLSPLKGMVFCELREHPLQYVLTSQLQAYTDKVVQLTLAQVVAELDRRIARIHELHDVNDIVDRVALKSFRDWLTIEMREVNNG